MIWLRLLIFCVSVLVGLGLTVRPLLRRQLQTPQAQFSDGWRRRFLPVPPTGKPDGRFRKTGNRFDEMHYDKWLSSTEGLLINEASFNRSLDEAFRSRWMATAKYFRELLTENGRNNADPDLPLEEAPFRRAFLNVSSSKMNYTTIVPMDPPLDLSIGDAMAHTKRFSFCLENPYSCGNVTTPPIVDISLIVPLVASQSKLCFTLLESVRQLVVFPSEIVFVVSGAADSIGQHTLTFLKLLKDAYVDFLPKGVRLDVYGSKKTHCASEQRLFGAKKTTNQNLLVFDSDDYMHPQLFQILDRIYSERFEGDAFLGGLDPEHLYECPRGYFSIVMEHLRQRHYTEEMIKEAVTYPNSDYESVRSEVPTWNKTWYLGNTDAEPNWGMHSPTWWMAPCANGWLSARRHVFDSVPVPWGKAYGEDSIFNYRILRSGFNMKCLRKLRWGVYLPRSCKHVFQW